MCIGCLGSLSIRLENKIVDVQRELASSLLLGEHALELAEKAGVGLRANGIPEPPNPWEGLTLQLGYSLGGVHQTGLFLVT